MKSWLKKFKISAALDEKVMDARPQAPSGRSTPEADFAARLNTLDQQLRAARPIKPVPDNLHWKIMGVVRRAAGESASRTAGGGNLTLRWLRASAMVLLLGAGAWSLLHERAPGPRPTVARIAPRTAQVAFTGPNVGQPFPRDLRLDALAPLEKEMKLVQGDLQKAMEVAIASLPLDRGTMDR